MGTLYLVATPIGNLEDITGRALRILQGVRLIAAEDTRQTKKLLDHYHIRSPLISYHEHNKLARLPRILAELSLGDIALVSDAGTPGLNDPGYELVRAVLQAGHAVVPIPGPCAPIAALVASGLPTDAFLYLGYLPRKTKERRDLLSDIATLPFTLIFLESPRRLLTALQDIRGILGDRQVAVGRELTKLHEEIFRGRLDEAIAHFTAQPPRGEITLVVEGCSSSAERWSEDQLRDAIRERLSSGESPSRIATELSAISAWTRRGIYQKILETIHNSSQKESNS